MGHSGETGDFEAVGTGDLPWRVRAPERGGAEAEVAAWEASGAGGLVSSAGWPGMPCVAAASVVAVAGGRVPWDHFAEGVAAGVHRLTYGDVSVSLYYLRGGRPCRECGVEAAVRWLVGEVGGDETSWHLWLVQAGRASRSDDYRAVLWPVRRPLPPSGSAAAGEWRECVLGQLPDEGRTVLCWAEPERQTLGGQHSERACRPVVFAGWMRRRADGSLRWWDSRGWEVALVVRRWAAVRSDTEAWLGEQ